MKQYGFDFSTIAQVIQMQNNTGYSGGITLEDIDLLMETGLHGVALSGLLTQNPTLITTLNEKIHVNI